MSIADFYIEHGIDPTDPFHADRICDLARGDDGDQNYGNGGGGDNWPLNESELDAQAKAKEWTKLKCQQTAMASYRKDEFRLNFYLSTGTVGSCLDHPKKGKTQLFRKYLKNPMSLFDNPRGHTGQGYYTKGDYVEENAKNRGTKRKAQGQCDVRSCAACGESKPVDEFSKTQRRKGPNSKCKECVRSS
ncbi:hypothetical protein ACHAXR_007967 [Thalassiosira sp. AJA248-18]